MYHNVLLYSIRIGTLLWINLEFLTRGWRYAVLSCLGDCFAKHLAAPAKEIQEVDITIRSLNEGHIQDSNDLIRHAIWYAYRYLWHQEPTFFWVENQKPGFIRNMGKNLFFLKNLVFPK